ncbi:MAG TPA: amidohydrolase family protein [candidate division Zixibacteria bacterium]|nr:amidohydrolase family protein [candidate division Zixibacteria bacterium]
MAFQGHAIVDADGHVIEDTRAIVGFMPRPYQEKYETHSFFNPFPPLDHLHSSNLHDFPPGAFNKVGPDGWVDFLEDVGIESTVLYTTLGLAFGKIVSRDWAIDVARAYNDWICHTYLKKSPRFQAMALVPLQEPEAAVEELRRAVRELGMCGAMLPSTGIQAHLGDPRYWPIYEEADRLGCAIGIHGGAHENLGLDDLTPYAPVHALGHPFGQMISFAGIVFNGVLDRFPNARFGFMEGGVAWLLLCLERFDRSWETHVQHDPRGRFLRLRPKEKVSDYIARHIDEGRIFVGCEGDEPDIAHAIRRVGAKPFLYSSDFPHEVNNEFCKHEIGEMLDNRELTDADKSAVLHENARRFYRLRPAGL